MDGAARRIGATRNSVPRPLKENATANGLWQFCLHHHDKHDVVQACQKLQEQYKGNANLALLLAWLEDAGFSISAFSLAVMRQAVNQSEPLLRRYRLMRREMKPQINHSLYQQMLNYELMLEKYQQQELLACINQQKWLENGPSALNMYCKQLHPTATALYCGLMKNLRTFSC